MTQCPKGDHEIPDEDEVGARCDEHGVTLLWCGPPITTEDLTPGPDASRGDSYRRTVPPSAPQRALGQHTH